MEKARQVADMHQIYRRAKVVIVWLGPEDDDSDVAMAAVSRLAEVLPSLSVVPLRDRLPEYGLPANGDPMWPALGCLFSRAWFFRLWTFQEIILATSAIVCCGNSTVEWPKLEVVGYGVHQRRLWPLTISEKTRQVQFRGFTSVANIAVMKANVNSLTRCKLEKEPYLQLVTNQKRRPDLPSWCLDLQPQELEMMFDDYLRAGLREESTDSNRANIKIFSESDDIEIQGFRADIVDRVVPMDFVWSHQRLPENTKNVVGWESECRLLACDTLGLPQDEVPISHVCTLSANIKSRQADFKALAQGYRDQITHMVSQAEGRGDCPPPIERQPPYDNFWLQMTRTCPGRTYFSTVNGRVGIGPPEIQSGDLVVVIYGAEPVFLLRELPAPDARMELIGDAFVHGLMDLSETPEEAIGPTEWFVIC